MSGKEDDVYKKLKNLAIGGSSDINILLLGGTGVGKSTFINSLANYITFNDIAQPENERRVEVLIPSKFSVKDKNGKYHSINTGEEDKNEYIKTGQSATQDVKTYVFPIYNNKINVRIIDTPGLQDTRNVGQDAINCENILSYIGQLHELHAICFLFEPNATRNTVVFRYCIDQMLTRLDKSASKNIIFIFTNTRGSDYRPGETIGLLEEIINKLKRNPPYIEIPLKKNVFCFDNECFHYLAARKNKIKFDSTVKEDYRKSWKHSSNEFWKLIKYIEGDTIQPPLKPHYVKNTSAINEARRMIVQLAQPLTEIVQLINHNLEALNRHEDSLNLVNQTLEQMKSKLYMPVVTLDVIKLTQPATVCTSRECADLIKVAGKNSWHYKQRCHDPCYLQNVPKEIIGASELRHCASMSAEYCIKCKHCFSIHMHIYYMTKLKEEQQKDPNIEGNIHNKEKILEEKRKLIDTMTTKRLELMDEHVVIVNLSARFAHFLENNAIAPFSDSYRDYIEYLINREQSLGKHRDIQTINYLQTLIRDYEEAKNAYDEALKYNKKYGRTDEVVTVHDIQNGIQELYKLKHNGSKIRELYECQKKVRQKEHQNNEYVHKVPRKALVDSQVQNKNEKGKKEDQKETMVKNKNVQQSRNVRHQPQARSNTNPPPYRDIQPRPRPPDYQSHPGQPDYRSPQPGQPHFHPQYRGQPDNAHYPYWQQAFSAAPYPSNPNQRFDSQQRKNSDSPFDIKINVQSTESRPNDRSPSGQSSFHYPGNQYQGNPYPGNPYLGPPHYAPSGHGYFPPPQGYYPPENYPYYPQGQYPHYNQQEGRIRSDRNENRERNMRNYNRGTDRGRGYRGGRGQSGRVHKSKPDKKKHPKKGRDSDTDDSSSIDSSDS